MAGTLKLLKTPRPTLINDEFSLASTAVMAIGILMGGLSMPLSFTSIGVGLIAGWFGKRKMEREQQAGKDIGEPTLFNKKGLIGGLNFFVMTSVIAGMFHTSVAPLVLAGITAVGTVLSALGGRREQQIEYHLAECEQHARTISKGRQKTLDLGLDGMDDREPGRFAQKELLRRRNSEQAITSGAVAGSMIP